MKQQINTQLSIYNQKLKNLTENRAKEFDRLTDQDHQAYNEQIQETAGFINVLKKLESESENQEKPGGFFDLPKIQICNHKSHNPPSHLYIPPGKGYTHICPGCGKRSILIPPQVSF